MSPSVFNLLWLKIDSTKEPVKQVVTRNERTGARTHFPKNKQIGWQEKRTEIFSKEKTNPTEETNMYLYRKQ